jgi:hypothetical protein
VTPIEASALAAEAFVFGYPLVLMDVSRLSFLGQSSGDGHRNAMNELSHAREFPDASFTAVVSPNTDTLNSTAWLDVAAEPVVLSVPATSRYYALPMLSAWTDVFASPGTRTAGEGGAFAVVGPGWRGGVPEGVQEIRSPTSLVWLAGRTEANGEADYEEAHRFQDGLSLSRLSGASCAHAPDSNRDSAIDTETPPPEQVGAMDASTFFGRLAELMVDNPPAQADTPALERFGAIGLAPGKFEPPAELAGAVEAGVSAANAGINVIRRHRADLTNGWSIPRDLGRYGTNYVQRALIALFGLGASLPEDVVYPHTVVDGNGQPLSGADNCYVLHFAPESAPPAQAFWSLTMYNERHYFVDNPIDRYAIRDRDPLVFNPDGSLDIWLQHERPAPAHVANWLPAPDGPFSLILRIYWPRQEVIDGTWVPPPVTKVA